VKTNFADIERDAALADQRKFAVRDEVKKEVAAPTEDDIEDKIASMRLAYKDLSVKQKNEELRLKQMDPKKAKQVERLGMGFSSKAGISHSMADDMEELDTSCSPVKKSSPTTTVEKQEDEEYLDCFVTSFSGVNDLLVVEMNSGKKPKTDDFGFNDDEFKSMSRGGRKETMTKKSLEGTTATKYLNEYSSSSSRRDQEKKKIVWDEEKSSKKGFGSPRGKAAVTADDSGEAQRKFGTAKSISSAQYFGNNDNSGEERMNLHQFEGSTSISSADFFGHSASNNDYSGIQTPDFDDVKESVRQGVTKVAGKLSSLASGVMTSIQEKYGGY